MKPNRTTHPAIETELRIGDRVIRRDGMLGRVIGINGKRIIVRGANVTYNDCIQVWAYWPSRAVIRERRQLVRAYNDREFLDSPQEPDPDWAICQLFLGMDA